MSGSAPPVLDLAEAVDRARRLSAPGARRVLGVAGAPGAGKSTVAAAVVRALAPDAALLPMDGFHLAQAELDRLGRADRKGAPDTFDVHGFVALLRRLRTPAPEAVVYAPRFDRHLEESVAGALEVAPELPLVVVEGNYLLHDDGAWSAVAGLLDECWYLEVDEALRRERLVARHVTHGRTPDAARAWALGPDEANARLVARSRARADVVVRPDPTEPSGGRLGP